MPVKQVTMRKIKECLRMKWSCGLSHDKIAKAVGARLKLTTRAR
jgi:hypothetical protein